MQCNGGGSDSDYRCDARVMEESDCHVLWEELDRDVYEMSVSLRCVEQVIGEVRRVKERELNEVTALCALWPEQMEEC